MTNRTPLKKMIYFISIPIIIFFLFLAFLTLRQDQMIFFPEKLEANHRFPFTFPFEELNLEPEPGVTINAILAKTPQSKGLVFYSHGNAGSLDTWGTVCPAFLEKGYDVLVYDYRGYGKSTGEIKSQQQLIGDAQYILDQVMASYQEKTLVIYGRSLGSGVATAIANAHTPDLLILETPYKSFIKLVREYYPFVPAFLIKYTFPTEALIPELECPVFIIHGSADEVIPFKHSLDLFEQNPSIEFFVVKDGTHNDLDLHPAYQKMLNRLSELLDE